MSEQNDSAKANNDDGSATGPLAGERLAEARREKQISVDEVAKELHLDEPKVLALERNEFEILGAPVFAKGHLRKYAQLVGVSIDDVLADYYALNRAVGIPPVVGKVRKPAREISPGPWVAAIAVFLVLAFFYWWFVERDPAPDATPSPQSEQLAPPAETDAATAEVDEAPAAVDLEEAMATESEPAEPEPVEPEPAASEESARPSPPLTDGDVRLSMTFSGECWTEITDAGGDRLFFDLGRAGRTVSVSGRAPLSVLFGNADNVSIQVNGTDYSISPLNRRGQTARLTIMAP